MLITKPDDEEYLTLSYVWGNRKPPIWDSRRLKNLLDFGSPPQVVRDAMAVTLELGYRYLWVDKYCINQADVAGKMAEISIMDQIYENAILTIVDAAGNHDDYGLVGCGTTPIRRREQQPVTCVGTRTYTWTLIGVACVVNSSPWITRGWTFQEGLLSTRCLFFTKEQFYFVCKEGSECETVPRRPSANYFNDKIKLGNLFETDQSMVNNTEYGAIIKQGDLADVTNLTDIYAARSLTYDSDALNAFRGILARCHFHTYWGIPFIKFTQLLRFRRAGMMPADFSGPGNVTAAFLAGLAWKPNTRVNKDRTSIPSWSWLGISNVLVKFVLDSITENDGEDQTLSTRNATYEVSAKSYSDELDTAIPILKIWSEADNWVIPELSRYIKITAPAAKVFGVKWRRPVSLAFEALLLIELSIEGSNDKTWTLDCDTRRTWLRLKKASRQSTEIPLDLKVIWLKHSWEEFRYTTVTTALELYRNIEANRTVGVEIQESREYIFRMMAIGARYMGRRREIASDVPDTKRAPPEEGSKIFNETIYTQLERHGSKIPRYFILDLVAAIMKNFPPELLELIFQSGKFILWPTSDDTRKDVNNWKLVSRSWYNIISQIVISPLAFKALAKNGTQDLILQQLSWLYRRFPSHFFSGNTIVVSSSRGHDEVVSHMVEKGADVNTTDDQGRTALHYAAINGHTNVVRLLLDSGSKVRVSDHAGSTALHGAARYGHETIVRLLLIYKAERDAYDSCVRTALHLSAEMGHEAVVQVLLDRDANIEGPYRRCDTPLQLAASAGQVAMVQFLIDRQANITACYLNGESILIRAVGEGREEIVQILLRHGANIEARNDWRETALLTAVSCRKPGIVKFLIEQGARVTAENKWRRTALHLAARNGDTACVELLVAAGADIAAKDGSGRSVLGYALEGDHHDVIQILSKYQPGIADGLGALIGQGKKEGWDLMGSIGRLLLALKAKLGLRTDTKGRPAQGGRRTYL